MNRKNKRLFSLATALLLTMLSINIPQVKAGYSQSDKPLFLIISTNWCFACKKLHPIIEELEAQYGGQVDFLSLDASSDETVNSSRQVAEQYGLASYFDSNRNVFPKVSILCPGSVAPEKVIIGAYGKETYVDAINSFILDPSKICNINGRPAGGDKDTAENNNEPARPNEPEIPAIAGVGRPEVPDTLDRPNEVVSSGRPNELTFWSVGQPIPIAAYYQYLFIPRCSTGNNVICANSVLTGSQDVKANSDTNGTVFKPYDPNASRNEKGYHF